MTEPWTLAGDFNDIMILEEQREDTLVNERKCKIFYYNVSKCNLIDIGLEGPSLHGMDLL